MKIITGVNKWQVETAEGVSYGIYGAQADAEAKAASIVEAGDADEAYVMAIVSRFALPPVRAMKFDV